MIPLDVVAIGDALGGKSALQDKEVAIKGYMGRSDARFSHYSNALCNPNRIGAEQDRLCCQIEIPTSSLLQTSLAVQ